MRKKWKQWNFIFLGSRINVDGDYGHEIKRCLLLGGITMSNLDSVLKSRDVTLPTKVHLVKATVFLVVMYGCESCTMKNGEHGKIDAFELWCWRRLLKNPLGSKEIKPIHHKGSQPWIFIGRTDAEAEAQMFWPPDVKSRLTGQGRPWRWERLRVGGERGQKMIWLEGIIDTADMNLSKLWEIVKDGETWRAAIRGVPKSGTRLSDWTAATTEIPCTEFYVFFNFFFFKVCA